MAKTIVALFDTPADADAAAQHLREAGFDDADVDLIRHSGYGAGEGYGDIMPQLLGWGVPHDEAVAYAEGLRRGGALLAITPDDDAGVDRAVGLLDDRGTVDMGARTAEWRATGWTGEPPPPIPAGSPETVESDRSLSDAADALRSTNAEPLHPAHGTETRPPAGSGETQYPTSAEAVPPPPADPGIAAPSLVPGSASDVAQTRLDREDPERRS